jgi:hypothetical protein
VRTIREQLIFSVGLWSLAFAGAMGLGIAGCGAVTPAPTPTPIPVPVPDPVTPPDARILTAAEYESVVPHTTTETEIVSRFGTPWKRSPIMPGTLAFVYPTKDAIGAEVFAELWVRSGLVIYKTIP